MTMPFTPDMKSPFCELLAVTVNENPHCPEGTSDEISAYLPAGAQLYTAAYVDKLNAEVESHKALSVANILLEVVPGDGSGHEVYAKSVDAVVQKLSAMDERLEQLNDGWVAACRERDTLRDVLRLLAPDLKTMAILYAQKGDHQRSQALANICKSVGVE